MVDQVKVFGTWGSPFSKRVELCLKLKGIPYEFVEEDLKNKSSSLLLHNPVHKRVPLLLHNGNPISESLIILEYINDTWEHGPPILPKDPYHRALARFWAKFIDEKCIPTLRKACWSVGEEREKAKEEAKELLKHLDKEVEGKKFFGGDTVGIVDLAAGFIAYWFVILSECGGVGNILAEENLPNLCEWMEVYTNDGLVKENLPPRDRLTDKFRALFHAAAVAKQAT